MDAACDPPAGNIAWEGDPPMGFHYKMFTFKNNGGKKSRVAQNWPGQLVLSRGAKSRSSPKSWDASTDPAASMEDQQHPLSPAPCPGSALNHQQIWEQWPHPRVKRSLNATPCRELQNLARRGPNPAHGPAGNGPGSPVSRRKT